MNKLVNLFSPIYRILFVEEAPCHSPEGQNIVKAYVDWYITSDGVYIRISGSTKAPHWLPHFVPDTLLLQEIAYQTYVNDPKKRLVFCPPLDSKRLLFEGMIPKENLKNICSRPVSHGVMIGKTYFLGN